MLLDDCKTLVFKLAREGDSNDTVIVDTRYSAMKVLNGSVITGVQWVPAKSHVGPTCCTEESPYGEIWKRRAYDNEEEGNWENFCFAAWWQRGVIISTWKGTRNSQNPGRCRDIKIRHKRERNRS